MSNCCIKVHVRFLVVFLFLFSVIPIDNIYASYNKVAPGDSITIGEYVFDDDFVATTTLCTIGITDSAGVEKVVSTTPMTANSDGWHYYSYSVPAGANTGIWPSVMICGSVSRGDLVKVDKTFMVDSSMITLSNLNTASSSIGSAIQNSQTDINSHTDIASSSLGSAITNAQTAINTNTNTQLGVASSSVAAVINANTDLQIQTASSSIVSQVLSSIANVPSLVWGYTGRTLSNFGTLVADVWTNTTRTLTEGDSSWQLNVSDFNTVRAGNSYLATINITNNGKLTDSLNVPTVIIYDPSRNVVVNGVAMARTSTGIYTYSYSTSASAEAGNWETTFSATVESGKNLSGTDYWNVTSSPAQVIINNISNTIVPDITANVTITNEGLTGYEYQYEWCVVSNENNSCGGSDDVFYATAAKYINPGEDFNTTLTTTVSSAGNYYFKLKVYFGSDSSVSSRSFTATSENSGSGNSSGSGGGGGGGGGILSVPIISANSCNGADFNADKRVNSIDFSILLSFWQTTPPFKNPCVDINKDNKVNSVDFSIMLYEWESKK